VKKLTRETHRKLDAVFALALGALCVWYLGDAYAASSRVSNLILIMPAALVGVVLAVAIAVQQLYTAGDESKAARAPVRQTDGAATARSTSLRTFGMMVALVIYVLVQEWLGFDVATMIFMVVSLVILGERRVVFILVYASLFTIANIYIQKIGSFGLPLTFM
jgi:putative tricarboxylic transport membrane protein